MMSKWVLGHDPFGVWGKIDGMWGIYPQKHQFGILGHGSFGIWGNISGLWGSELK